MTSIRLELDQVAQGFFWPVRALAAAVRALDRELRHAGVRRAVKMAVDFSCGAAAVVTAVAVGEGIRTVGVGETASLALLVGLVLVVADGLGGSYRAIWRYTSMREALALSVSSAIVLGALLALRGLGTLGMSVATLLLVVLLMLFLCAGVRALRRWSVTEAKQRARPARAGVAPRHRVLIAGAGQHGLSIGRELMEGAAPSVQLVGFLDDDPAKHGALLNGVSVLGGVRDAVALAQGYDVDEMIVAMPSATRAVVRALGRRLEQVGIRVRAIGGIDRFVRGRDVHRPGSVTLHELLDGAPVPVAPTAHATTDGSRRVLVTGGAGFIGSHLTRMLLDRGYCVRVLDRFDYGRAGIEGLRHPRLEVLGGDVCSSRDVGRALRDVHGVIALAAIVGDPACNLDPEETINLNYTATKILIEACNFHRVRRLSTVFGLSPRMRFDLVVNTLTVRAVADGGITINGGNQWRPNVHCRDAARAFIAALEAPAERVAGEIFNVGGDALNHTIAQLGDMVAEIVGDVQIARQRDGTDLRDYRVSFAKIRRVLGFEPEWTVAAGIREVAAAVRAQPALRDYQNPVYHNVQALRQTLTMPRRRRGDWTAAREPTPATPGEGEARPCSQRRERPTSWW